MKIVLIGLLCLVFGLYLGANGGWDWMTAMKIKAMAVVEEKQAELTAEGQKEQEYSIQSNTGPQKLKLTTIKTWTGEGSKTLNYSVTHVPLVFKASYSPKGNIVGAFHVSIERVIAPGLTVIVPRNVITTPGDYKFIVDAPGYKWQIDIGREQ